MADFTQIQVRRDTLANFVAAGVVPLNGEPIGLIDAASGKVTSYLIGDGDSTVDQLPALSKGDKGDQGGQGDKGLPGVNAVSNDTATAAQIETEGTATQAALAEYGVTQFSYLNRVHGGHFLCAGDSLTATGEDRTPPTMTGVDSLASSIAALSDGRLWYDQNAGVPGNQSGQLLARIQTDVVAYDPDVCVVWIGTNDAGASIPLTTYMQNMKGIVAALKAAHIFPVVCLVPPRADIDTAKQFSNAYNAWLLEWAPTQNVPIVDFYSALVDPATGKIADAYNFGDQIHLKAVAYPVLAQLVVDALRASTGAASTYLAKDAVDPSDLLQGAGLFLGAPTGGLPEGWSTGDAAHLSFATAAADVGKSLTLTANGDVGYQVQAYRYLNPISKPGDVIEVTGVMTSTAAAGNVATVQLSINGSTAPDVTSIAVQSGITRTGGSFKIRTVVPPGMTDMLVRLMAGPSAGTATFKRLRARNLTALGID